VSPTRVALALAVTPLAWLSACFFTIAPLERGIAPDAAADVVPAPAVVCDRRTTFGAPRPIDPLNTAENDELWPRLSADELTIVLGTVRAPDAFGVYMATRSSRELPFGRPTFLSTVNAQPAFDADPMLSADGLTLYLHSTRDGNSNLFYAKRSSTTAVFERPIPIASLNTPLAEIQPFLSADVGTLWFAREGPTGAQIFRAPVRGDVYGPAEVVAELDSEQPEWLPTPSADGLTIYFASKRSGGAGDFDIWVAHRARTDAPFDQPTPVVELNTAALDAPGFLSPDMCRLYFHRAPAPGRSDVFVAERPAR
jgi:hypothetical protein